MEELKEKTKEWIMSKGVRPERIIEITNTILEVLISKEANTIEAEMSMRFADQAIAEAKIHSPLTDLPKHYIKALVLEE